LVIESHALAREALCAAIAEEPDFKLAGQVVSGAEALGMLITTPADAVLLAFRPDLILLALGNPGRADLETLRALRKSLPNVPLLALTSPDVEGQAQVALYAGAQAVLSKFAPRAELIRALRELRQASLGPVPSDFEHPLP
jgi:two-component system secretion response regulator SsrB